MTQRTVLTQNSPSPAAVFHEETPTSIKLAETLVRINGMKRFYRRTARLAAAIVLPLAALCLLFCSLAGARASVRTENSYVSFHSALNDLAENEEGILEIRTITPSSYSIYVDTDAWNQYTEREQETFCRQISASLKALSLSRGIAGPKEEIQTFFYSENGSLLGSL